MAFRTQNVDYTSTRIKEVEAPGMWQDFHLELVPCRKSSVYFNDFHQWNPTGWTVTEVGTCTQSILDARNGILSLISGGTENNGTQLALGGSTDAATTGESFHPQAGKNLWFEISVAASAWTQHEIFFGFAIEDTSVAESKPADYIGFVSNDGSATVAFQSSNTSVVTTLAAIHTPTDSATTFNRYGFKVTSTDKVEVYVNDALVGTITTNIPTTEMKLTIAHTTGEASAKTLNIDYVAAAQDR